jgi:hypothetical protein
MAALDFPNSPSINDEYTVNGVTYVWDGDAWGSATAVVYENTVQTITNKTINATNNTITNISLTTGVTGTLPVANGGTGATTLTTNNVLLGNGTSALQAVAPGTTGNVLTSNGTTWTSAAAPSPTIASTAEAQAGTNNTTFITPLRIREGFNASGSAPVYACRAWVNFDGTGTFSPNPSTTQIRASGNVSSILKNGTGNYTVNFTTNMPSEDYCTTVSSRRPSEAAGAISNIFTGGTYSTSAVQVRSSTFGAGAVDVDIFNVSVFI